MKTAPLLIPLLSLTIFLNGCQGGHSLPVPGMADGVLDVNDTLSLGLRKCEDMKWIEVFHSEGYVNNAVLTHFNGKYYCMWQQSEKDEDSPDTGIMYAMSPDGEAWSQPCVLVPPSDEFFASPGGWIQRGDSLTAIINYIFAADRSRGGKAFYSSTSDGIRWSEPKPVLSAEGSPIEGIFEQDPLTLSDGRIVGAIHFQPGTTLCPVYTDDPSGIRGWRKADFPEGEGHPIEPSQYRTSDGNLVMFMRDQKSSFVKLYSISTDLGESWSAPLYTNIPDSRSKQCAGTLSDGRSFWVGNPTGNKSRRALVLSLSEDGYFFDQAFLLAGPRDLPPRRNDGRYKTLGYNYPKACVVGDTLWIALSINKEDIDVIRIPIICMR